MGRFEDYIEAVTRRLRPDPELHMDVVREVRAHLEDAAEEARARGLSDEEAAEAALAAFGEADEIAGALWEANRGRMRLRAVLKWAARVTLLPAALLVALYICSTYFRQFYQVAPIALRMRSSSAWLAYMLPRSDPPELQPRKDLTPRERFEFEHISWGLSDAQALLKLDPSNPSFHAHHVQLPVTQKQPWMAADQLEATLIALERAESVEPQNAFYNYLRAGALMARSSHRVPEDEICFEYAQWDGGKKEECGLGLLIEDRATFEDAISEVLRGVKKPYCDSRVFDLVRRKIRLAKSPATLTDQLGLRAYVGGTRLVGLTPMRRMIESLPAYAAQLASEGRREEAIELLEIVDRPAVQMGAGAQAVIELMVARAVLVDTLGQMPVIYRRLNMPERAMQARERFERENERRNSLRRERHRGEIPQEEVKRYGFLYSSLASSFPGVDHSHFGRPLTALEHLMSDGVALAVLEALLLLLALRCAAATGWNLWRYRKRADGPKLFFVGWRRVAGIVLLGLILPIGVYAAYSRLAPFSSMRYGIQHYPYWVALEKATLVALILIVILAASYRAIRARCRDAGMEAPAKGFFNPLRSRAAILCAALLAAASTANFLFTGHVYGRDFLAGWLTAAIVLFALVYVLWQFRLMKRLGPGTEHFRMSFVRSLLPILTACLLLLGLTSLAFLRSVEARYVAQLNRPGAVWGLDELENSALKGYRDHLRELNRKWNQEHGIEGAEPQMNADERG